MIRRILLVLFIVVSSVGAQAPEHVADAAIEQWLAQPAMSPDQLLGLSAEEVCEELPRVFQIGAPLPGTRVHFENRLRHEQQSAHELQFTYPAISSGNRYDIVQVMVHETNGHWVAGEVEYRPGLNTDPGRTWVQTPTGAFIFTMLSLLVFWLLFSPGKNALKRVLQDGISVLKQHRRIVIFSLIGLYAAFAFGAFLGSGLPAQCAQAVSGVLEQALRQVGATDAYGSGNIPRAASLTFYQNFAVVTLTLLFPLAMLFGIPGYAFALASFTAQAIPFGFISGAGPLDIVVMGVVLVLELTAYFLVTAGGGIVLATVIKKGFRGFPDGFLKLTAVIPLAAVLLLIGAWFEAAALLLF